MEQDQNYGSLSGICNSFISLKIPEPSLPKCIKYYYGKNEFVDMYFLCNESKRVGSHKLLLISLSDFLKEIISNKEEDLFISIPVEEAAMLLLMQVLYFGTCTIRNLDDLASLEEVTFLLQIGVLNEAIDECKRNFNIPSDHRHTQVVNTGLASSLLSTTFIVAEDDQNLEIFRSQQDEMVPNALESTVQPEIDEVLVTEDSVKVEESYFNNSTVVDDTPAVIAEDETFEQIRSDNNSLLYEVPQSIISPTNENTFQLEMAILERYENSQLGNIQNSKVDVVEIPEDTEMPYLCEDSPIVDISFGVSDDPSYSLHEEHPDPFMNNTNEIVEDLPPVEEFSNHNSTSSPVDVICISDDENDVMEIVNEEGFSSWSGTEHIIHKRSKRSSTNKMFRNLNSNYIHSSDELFLLESTASLNDLAEEVTSASQNKSDSGAHKKIKLTATQTSILENYFVINKHVQPTMRKQLAEIVGISELNLRYWFINRRRKEITDSRESERPIYTEKQRKVFHEQFKRNKCVSYNNNRKKLRQLHERRYGDEKDPPDSLLVAEEVESTENKYSALKSPRIIKRKAYKTNYKPYWKQEKKLHATNSLSSKKLFRDKSSISQLNDKSDEGVLHALQVPEDSQLTNNKCFTPNYYSSTKKKPNKKNNTFDLKREENVPAKKTLRRKSSPSESGITQCKEANNEDPPNDEVVQNVLLADNKCSNLESPSLKKKTARNGKNSLNFKKGKNISKTASSGKTSLPDESNISLYNDTTCKGLLDVLQVPENSQLMNNKGPTPKYTSLAKKNAYKRRNTLDLKKEKNVPAKKMSKRKSLQDESSISQHEGTTNKNVPNELQVIENNEATDNQHFNSKSSSTNKKTAENGKKEKNPPVAKLSSSRTSLPDESNSLSVNDTTSKAGRRASSISNYKDGRNKSFNEKQTKILEGIFQASGFPSIADRRKIAEDLEVEERIVKNWFINRKKRMTDDIFRGRTTSS